MLNPINVQNAPAPLPPPGAAAPGGESAPNFKSLLIDSIGQVNSMQHDADLAVESLVTGGDVNPAEVFTAVQKADMAFRMMMQIRNKLVQAYNEVKDLRV